MQVRKTNDLTQWGKQPQLGWFLSPRRANEFHTHVIILPQSGALFFNHIIKWFTATVQIRVGVNRIRVPFNFQLYWISWC